VVVAELTPAPVIPRPVVEEPMGTLSVKAVANRILTNYDHKQDYPTLDLD
jgi:hypothetical protein